MRVSEDNGPATNVLQTQWLNSAGTGRNGVPPPVSGVPPPEIAVPPPKVVVPPPGNDVTSPFGGGGGIIKIVVTRGQILRLKCTKYYFDWGSASDNAGGDYSACPEPLEGASLLLRGRIEEGNGRKGRGRNVAFHHLLLSNLTTVQTCIEPRSKTSETVSSTYKWGKIVQTVVHSMRIDEQPCLSKTVLTVGLT